MVMLEVGGNIMLDVNDLKKINDQKKLDDALIAEIKTAAESYRGTWKE